MTENKDLTLYVRIPVAKKLTSDEVRNISIEAKNGIRALYARKRRLILTYLFDSKKWSTKKANTWLKENKNTVSKKIFRGGYLVKQYGQDIDVLLEPLDDYAEFGEMLDSILGETAQKGFTTGLDEVGALTKKMPKELLNKLKDQALSLSKLVADTLKANISSDIIDGVNEGLTTSEIASKILERQDKPLTIKVKPKYDAEGNVVREGYTRSMSAKQWAEIVARTETAKAGVTAIQDAYSEVGLTKKMWLTNPGACPLCTPMDGKVFPIDAKTADLIPYHPNCRCTWLPVIAKQISGKIHKGIKNKGNEVYFKDNTLNMKEVSTQKINELARDIQI